MNISEQTIVLLLIPIALLRNGVVEDNHLNIISEAGNKLLCAHSILLGFGFERNVLNDAD